MPTPYEYALLANEAYRDPSQGYAKAKEEGWDVFDWSNPEGNDDIGFFGVAFINNSTNEIVIAYRGSDDFFDVDDALGFWDGLTFRNVPEQYGRAGIADLDNFGARKFIGKVQELMDNDSISHFTLSYTGHSLGAVLAELSVAQDGGKAVTFDSPGSSDIVSENPEYQFNTNPDIVSYQAYPNAINTLNPHLGDIYTVQPPFDISLAQAITAEGLAGYAFYTKQQHSMEKILERFDKDSGMPIVKIDRTEDWPEGIWEGLTSYFSSDEMTGYWNLYNAKLLSQGIASPRLSMEIVSNGWTMLNDTLGEQLSFNRLFGVENVTDLSYRDILTSNSPNVIIDRYPLANLASELGFEDEDAFLTANPIGSLLYQTDSELGEVLVYREGDLVTLPDGSQMDVGTLLLLVQFGELEMTTQGLFVEPQADELVIEAVDLETFQIPVGRYIDKEKKPVLQVGIYGVGLSGASYSTTVMDDPSTNRLYVNPTPTDNGTHSTTLIAPGRNDRFIFSGDMRPVSGEAEFLGADPDVEDVFHYQLTIEDGTYRLIYGVSEETSESLLVIFKEEGFGNLENVFELFSLGNVEDVFSNIQYVFIPGFEKDALGILGITQAPERPVQQEGIDTTPTEVQRGQRIITVPQYLVNYVRYNNFERIDEVYKPREGNVIWRSDKTLSSTLFIIDHESDDLIIPYAYRGDRIIFNGVLIEGEFTPLDDGRFVYESMGKRFILEHLLASTFRLYEEGFEDEAVRIFFMSTQDFGFQGITRPEEHAIYQDGDFYFNATDIKNQVRRIQLAYDNIDDATELVVGTGNYDGHLYTKSFTSVLALPDGGVEIFDLSFEEEGGVLRGINLKAWGVDPTVPDYIFSVEEEGISTILAFDGEGQGTVNADLTANTITFTDSQQEKQTISIPRLKGIYLRNFESATVIAHPEGSVVGLYSINNTFIGTGGVNEVLSYGGQFSDPNLHSRLIFAHPDRSDSLHTATYFKSGPVERLDDGLYRFMIFGDPGLFEFRENDLNISYESYGETVRLMTLKDFKNGMFGITGITEAKELAPAIIVDETEESFPLPEQSVLEVLGKENSYDIYNLNRVSNFTEQTLYIDDADGLGRILINGLVVIADSNASVVAEFDFETSHGIRFYRFSGQTGNAYFQAYSDPESPNDLIITSTLTTANSDIRIVIRNFQNGMFGISGIARVAETQPPELEVTVMEGEANTYDEYNINNTIQYKRELRIRDSEGLGRITVNGRTVLADSNDPILIEPSTQNLGVYYLPDVSMSYIEPDPENSDDLVLTSSPQLNPKWRIIIEDFHNGMFGMTGIEGFPDLEELQDQGALPRHDNVSLMRAESRSGLSNAPASYLTADIGIGLMVPLIMIRLKMWVGTLRVAAGNESLLTEEDFQQIEEIHQSLLSQTSETEKPSVNSGWLAWLAIRNALRPAKTANGDHTPDEELSGGGKGRK